MMLVARNFEKRRGLAAGIGSTGEGVGTIIWAQLIAGLVRQIQLDWTLRVLSLIVTCCTLVAATLLKDMNATIRKLRPVIAETPERQEQSGVAKHRPTADAGMKDIMCSVKMRFVCAGIAVAAHGMLTPMIGVVSFAAQHSVDKSERVKLVSYMGLGALVLRIVFAIVSVCSQWGPWVLP